MNRKAPIRTYQRKNAVQSAVSIYGPSLSVTVGKKWGTSPTTKTRKDPFETEIDENTSLNYDPFDTTFDRLAKNTRAAPQPLKIDNVSWLDSSDEVQPSNNSLLRVSIGLSNLTIHKVANSNTGPKSSHARAVKRKLPKQVKCMFKRKKLSKSVNKNDSTQNAVEDQKGTFTKLLQVQKKNNMQKKQSMETLDISMSCDNNFQQERNVENKMDCSEAEYSVMSISGLMKALNIKACSVKLQDIYKDKHKDKLPCIRNNCGSMKGSMLLENSRELKNHTSLTLNYSNSKTASQHKESRVRNCFVKLERLEPLLNARDAIDKPKVNAISSTPIHKSKKRFMTSLLLSPIPSYCNDEPDVLKEPVNDINKDAVSVKPDNTDISLCEKSNDIVSAESNEVSSLVKTSLIPPDSIKSENKESLVEDKAINPTRNHTTTICITDQSESLMEVSKTDVKWSSHIQNSEYSKSDMFSKTDISVTQSKMEISVSLLSQSKAETSASLLSQRKTETSVSSLFQSTASRTSGDDGCATSIGKSSTKSMGDESIDSEVMQDSPITLPTGTDNSFENLFSETEDIENVDNRNNSRQINNNESNSILQNASQKEDKNNSSLQLRVVLQRLQDPIRITNRRKPYRKWTLALSRISGNNSIQKRISDIQESMEENSKTEIPAMVEKSIEKSVVNASIVKDDPCVSTARTTKSCFLKPGKSWTRSLSILNSIKNGADSNAMPCKGKGWRGSVKVVLDMQKQEGCYEQKENYDRASQGTKPVLEECNQKRLTTDLAPISKRVSVRVVQIGEPAKLTDDASFLEAYGIVPRLTNTRSSTVSRRTSVNNVERTINPSAIAQDYSQLKAKEVVLNRCKQKDVIPFANYFAESYTGQCKKIGEGVYGEVFLHENESQKSVIKIIPIEGSECVNGERQKKFEEILSEIVIAMELHNLRFSSTHWTNSFVDVRSLKCIQGKYPDSLIKLWELYDDEKGSENDSPTMFSENQLFVSLELGHGGQDLEAFIFHTAEEALASFQQTALALAVAEDAVQFEHRDLHWGNILIARTDEKFVQYKFPDREFNVPTKGVKVSIIDFTLSRMSYESCCIFNDLALDPTLFTAQGDYQFEIYRLMKDTVANEWQKFEPYTNILWLHYTLDKMITAVRYKKKNLKAHKTAISKLTSIKNEILNYRNTFDFVTNCDMFANVQRTNL